MKNTFLLLFLFLSIKNYSQESCASKIVAPVLSETARKDFEQKLAIADAEYRKDSSNADAIIWYGRRTAYTGDYQRAIEIFSKGIALHPGDARMYRHRAHRYITIRCFDKAITDLEKASTLIRGKPDEIEPDGLPNAKNIPTSTLQSNISYHLGLAYFIKGNDRKALKAYKECLAVSKNQDMYVATAYWTNLTLRRMKKYEEAIALCNTIDTTKELIENKDYMKLLEIYRSKSNDNEIDTYATAIAGKDQTVASATVNAGIGYYCLLSGNKEKANEYFEKTIASGQWSAFGFIVAEAELQRMK